MPGILVILLLVVLVGVLAWFAWQSLQSLFQARLLLRVRSLASHLPDRPGPAAVRGGVSIEGRITDHGWEGCLWYRETTQVYRSRRKNSGWSTVTDTQKVAAFTVEAGGRPFHVDEFPSEVQGVESKTEYLDRGFLGIFHSNGDRRVVHRWLRTRSRMTVVGRVEQAGDEARLVKDNKVGLLFSPHEPGKAAAIEMAKGVAGLLGVTALLAAGLYVYYQHKG